MLSKSVPCRWTENWAWFVERLNVTSELHGDTFFRVTFEQSVFRDATCSAMLRRPRFYHRCRPASVTCMHAHVLPAGGCRIKPREQAY